MVFFSRKRKAASVADVRNEEAAKDGQNGTVTTDSSRKGTLSESAGSGDDDDAPLRPPVRKKQNTASSSTRVSPASEENSSVETSNSSKIQVSPPLNSKIFDADLADNTVNGRISSQESIAEKAEEQMLDLVPPTSTVPKAVKKKSKVENPMKVQSEIPSPKSPEHCTMKTDYAKHMDCDDYPTESIDHRRSHWVGILWALLYLFVFIGMAWNGLLLNERATFQLESLECRERLRQAHQAMGLSIELDDTNGSDGDNENSISDRLEEHQFYWQELEAQVRYWKKEAKKYQRYGDGFKEQCREDLQHLLSDVLQQKVDDPQV